MGGGGKLRLEPLCVTYVERDEWVRQDVRQYRYSESEIKGNMNGKALDSALFFEVILLSIFFLFHKFAKNSQ